jgi:hypothetical protein
MLSLSFWRDETAVRRGARRSTTALRRRPGGPGVREAEVIRDYGLNERDQAPSQLLPAGGGGARSATEESASPLSQLR